MLNNRMKIIVCCVFLLTGNGWANACQNTSNSEQIEKAREDRREMKRLTMNLASEADSVFVAYIKGVGESYIEFEDVFNLKGNASEAMKYVFDMPELVIGCGGLISYENNSIPEKSDRENYLVYVKSGKITRINHMGAFAPEPSGYEELEWVTKN